MGPPDSGLPMGCLFFGDPMPDASWLEPQSAAAAVRESVGGSCLCGYCSFCKRQSHFARYVSLLSRVVVYDPDVVSPYDAAHNNSSGDLGLLESLAIERQSDHLQGHFFHGLAAFAHTSETVRGCLHAAGALDPQSAPDWHDNSRVVALRVWHDLPDATGAVWPAPLQGFRDSAPCYAVAHAQVSPLDWPGIVPATVPEVVCGGFGTRRGFLQLSAPSSHRDTAFPVNDTLQDQQRAVPWLPDGSRACELHERDVFSDLLPLDWPLPMPVAGHVFVHGFEPDRPDHRDALSFYHEPWISPYRDG